MVCVFALRKKYKNILYIIKVILNFLQFYNNITTYFVFSTPKPIYQVGKK